MNDARNIEGYVYFITQVIVCRLSLQGRRHVPGGGESAEHLRPALHRERAVDQVRSLRC